MATFLIIVREAFEAALLLGILYAYLRQLGAHAQAHFVTIVQHPEFEGIVDDVEELARYLEPPP